MKNVVKIFGFTIIVGVLGFVMIFLNDANANVKNVFESKCAKCHGLKGKVTKRGENLGAKNFADLNWQKTITDNEIINAITNGKNKMPSWKGKITQNEIEELVHYVRVLLPHNLRNEMPIDIQKVHYGK